MTGDASSGDGGSGVGLESFPDGSLSHGQLGVLEALDAVEIVAPIVLEEGSGRVTHLDVVVDDTHYYVGWNPGEEQWERILVVADPADEDFVAVESSATVYDEAGEPVVWFDSESDPSDEAIAEFIWEYVEYTYPDTSGLQNIIGEAAEKLDGG